MKRNEDILHQCSKRFVIFAEKIIHRYYFLARNAISLQKSYPIFATANVELNVLFWLRINFSLATKHGIKSETKIARDSFERKKTNYQFILKMLQVISVLVFFAANYKKTTDNAIYHPYPFAVRTALRRNVN